MQLVSNTRQNILAKGINMSNTVTKYLLYKLGKIHYIVRCATLPTV